MERMMTLSEQAEEILEALWIAAEEEGRGFAEIGRLGIAAGDPAFAELQGLGLIDIEGQRVRFRPEGRTAGRHMIRRHRLAERLMMDVLDVKGEPGESKACRFEHLLNEGMDEKVCSMLNHPDTCPHGKPIPPGECCLTARRSGDLGVRPLTELKPGQEGEIAYIRTADEKKMQKLVAMGVLPGCRIRLMQSFPSFIFRVGYSEFAVDAGMAREIAVAPLKRTV